MLRYLTSGESHGECLVAVLDGMPAGLLIKKSSIDKELARRMFGYGRGRRMKIESDKAEILSGLRKNITIGSPIAIMIKNQDNSIDSLPPVLNARPGHADLSGVLKFGFKDARNVLERSSARETASRVAVGAMAKKLLAEFGISVTSHVIEIGAVGSDPRRMTFKQILSSAERSPVRCADLNATILMCKEIDKAMDDGDTLGGVFEILVQGAPAGLGSYTQWDKKLDALLAKAVISIQAIKGVSFGAGFEVASRRGSTVHDQIYHEKGKGFFRQTNNAGGIEGGMTNGENIIMRVAMKPIATLRAPLTTVNIATKKPAKASVERSDVCAVPAAGVIGEAVAAIEIANALIEKFGGDSIALMRRNFRAYEDEIRRF